MLNLSRGWKLTDVALDKAPGQGIIPVQPSRVEIVVQRKLLPNEVDDLVTRYRAGATQRELATLIGVHRQTVRRHLLKRGVPLRPQVIPTEQQEQEVIRLYVEHTQTFVEIAQQIGVSASTVRNVLLRRGVQRRPQARRLRFPSIHLDDSN